MSPSLMIPVLIGALLFPQAREKQEPLDKKARAALRICRDTLADPAATPAEKNQVIRSLGRIRHPLVIRGLLDVAVEGRPRERVEAMRTLARLDGMPEATRAVLLGLSHRTNRKSRNVRVEALGSLSALDNPAALPTVHRLIRDRDPYVAREAVRTVTGYGYEGSLKVLIDYLKIVERRPDPNEGRVVIYVHPFRSGPAVGLVVGDEGVREAWLRHKLLHKPMVRALQEATDLYYETYREWERWWWREGWQFRYPCGKPVPSTLPR